MRISDWSSDVCSSDLGAAPGFSEAESLSNIKLQRRAQIAARKRREILEEARMASRVDVEDVVRAQDQAGAVVRAERAQRQRRVDHRITRRHRLERSEEHTSELQSLMRISYAVFCLKKKQQHTQ